MITLRIQNTVLETELRLPCSEAELSQCLREIAITAEPPPKVYVKKMIDPQGFAFLKGTEIDVDEMNYLAKRMDSLTLGETDKLYAIVSQKSYMEPKDLINLTFNLDCYTLIHDLRDISSAGRNYLLTVNGGMTSEELSGKDLAKIGRDLIESGKGIYTDYGLLFRNEEIGFEEMYDGQVFPEYWYRGDILLSVELSYDDKREYAYLPEEFSAIRKAIHRLGAPSAEACAYTISDYDFPSDWWDRFTRLLETESIFQVNVLAQEIMDQEVDFDKLSAVCGYVGKWDSDTLLTLVKNLDEFEYLERAQNYKSVGILSLNRILDTKFPEPAAKFMDYEGYGKYLSSNQGGRFVVGGFVYLQEGITIQDVLKTEEAPTEIQPEPRL